METGAAVLWSAGTQTRDLDVSWWFYPQLCRMLIVWQFHTSSLQAVQLLSQFIPLTFNNRIFSEQHFWIILSSHDKHFTLKLRDELVQRVIQDYQWNLISQTVSGNLRKNTNYIQKAVFFTRQMADTRQIATEMALCM